MEIDKSLRGKSGIYRIDFGSKNCYVGSSHNIYKRLCAHLNELRKGTHHAPGLQNAYRKHGEEQVRFTVLELVEPVREKLIEREQYWIDALECYPTGYNACPTAGSPLGKKMSERTKKLWSKQRKGVPKQGKKAKGEANIDALEYCFVNPQGEIVRGRNLSLLCETHGLLFGAMKRLLTGKQIGHKGWTVPNVRKSKLEEKQTPYKLLSPDGEVFEGDNVRGFAKSKGLCPNGLQKVAKGRGKIHKGWTSLMDNAYQYKEVGRHYQLQSPEGEVHQGQSVQAFCRDRGLDAAAMHRVLDGTADHHKGWRLPGTQPRQKKRTGTAGRVFSFRSPDGCVHSGQNIHAFAKLNGLNSSLLLRVANGKASHHKGWTRT